jgi:hypothetical protein
MFPKISNICGLARVRAGTRLPKQTWRGKPRPSGFVFQPINKHRGPRQSFHLGHLLPLSARHSDTRSLGLLRKVKQVRQGRLKTINTHISSLLMSEIPQQSSEDCPEQSLDQPNASSHTALRLSTYVTAKVTSHSHPWKTYQHMG